MSGRIFVTGDTHGDPISRLSSKNFPAGKDLDKDDVVVICGDFGVIWRLCPDEREDYILDWLEAKPWTTLFVDGNHENHARLDRLDVVHRFGGKVGKVNKSVFHLKRGEIYEIGGLDVLAFGGAMSTDKQWRTVDVSWWEREVPTREEMQYCIDNMNAIKNEVDLVITHTMPREDVNAFVHKMGYHQERSEDPTACFLSEVKRRLTFKKWFCGHFHENMSFSNGNVVCLYGAVLEVDKG